jgi:hypothetical protein
VTKQLLRWGALPVTDRRWAAPLAAIALGFGLFVGVAIGPGTAGTFATGAAQIIEIPGLGAGDTEGDADFSPSRLPGSDGGAGKGATSSPTAGAPLPLSTESESRAPAATPEPSPPAAEPTPPGKEVEPEEQALSGVVVHLNPAARSYTLAQADGTLDAIHAGKRPQLGTKVSVPVRPLANGTFAEAGTRIREGTRVRATFSGTTTYVNPDPTGPAYTVSRRGASVLVRVRPDPAGAAPALPVLGAFVEVVVDIAQSAPPPAEPASPAEAESTTTASPSCAPDPAQRLPTAIQPRTVLWQRQLTPDDAPFTNSDFGGIVQATCLELGQLAVSADDIRESGHDLIFSVPPTIDLSRVEVGESVIATATIGADGVLGLTGLASDEGATGADDASATQGDLAQP